MSQIIKDPQDVRAGEKSTTPHVVISITELEG